MRGALFPRVGRPLKSLDLRDINSEGQFQQLHWRIVMARFPNIEVIL